MPALFGFKSPRRTITAPTYVGAGTSVGSGFTITPTLPAGWAQNDILIIMLSLCGTADPSAPSGYTRLTVGGSHYSSTDTRSIMFWKRAGSSESDPSISWPAGPTLYSWVAKVYAFRGCSTTDPPYNIYSNVENYQISSPYYKPRFPFINITVDKVFVFGAISNLVSGNSPESFTVTNNAGLTSTLTDQFYTLSRRTIPDSVSENCFGGVQDLAGTLGEVVLDFSPIGTSKGQNVIALAPAT